MNSMYDRISNCAGNSHMCHHVSIPMSKVFRRGEVRRTSLYTSKKTNDDGLFCSSMNGTRCVASPAGSSKLSQSCSTFEDYILELQNSIITEAERVDASGSFVRDRWDRDTNDSNAGYGITSVLEGGRLLEKAAVNVSVIGGTLSSARAQAMSSRGRENIDPKGGQSYSAAAMSLVFHSAHPFVPTLRADVRVFEVGGEKWFGGGCDLTPFYVSEEDFASFHRYWKNLCDDFDPTVSQLACKDV